MDVIVQNMEGCPLQVLDNARIYHAGGALVVHCEIVNRASTSVTAAVFAIGKDELAGLVAIDEVTIGEMLPGERRPVRLKLLSGGDGTIVGVYVGAYRKVLTCRGTADLRSVDSVVDGGEE